MAEESNYYTIVKGPKGYEVALSLGKLTMTVDVSGLPLGPVFNTPEDETKGAKAGRRCLVTIESVTDEEGRPTLSITNASPGNESEMYIVDGKHLLYHQLDFAIHGDVSQGKSNFEAEIVHAEQIRRRGITTRETITPMYAIFPATDSQEEDLVNLRDPHRSPYFTFIKKGGDSGILPSSTKFERCPDRAKQVTPVYLRYDGREGLIVSTGSGRIVVSREAIVYGELTGSPVKLVVYREDYDVEEGVVKTRRGTVEEYEELIDISDRIKRMTLW